MYSLAAIDIGTNATRLLMVEVSATGVVMSTRAHRFALRLGSDVFSEGCVSPQSAERFVEICAEIVELLAVNNVARYRAVATSALREASNGPLVVAQARQHTGLQVEIIGGDEESRLARKALLRAMGSARPGTILVDLGGGSLELEWAKGRVSRSLPFGTVRLVETYPDLAAPLGPGDLERIRHAIYFELRHHVRSRLRADTAIGTGGNLTALAQIIPRRGLGLPAIDLERLAEVASSIAPMSNQERVRTLGIRPDRADVILPAMLVFLGLRQLFHLRALVVPGTGLRESILHELVAGYDGRSGPRRVLKQMGQKTGPADRLAATARELFWALAPAHGLWAPALGALEAAAYLRDLGDVIDPKRRVEHALYLLRHVHDLALDPRSRDVAAYTVAAGHEHGATLPDVHPADRRAAEVCAVLLQVAVILCQRQARTQPTVDLMAVPLSINAGLPADLEPRYTEPLAQMLGREVRVC